ncbi:MAG TPA: asparagine synthase (glutamine-hydrolyzing) [Kofleriaceae bacterium]
MGRLLAAAKGRRLMCGIAAIIGSHAARDRAERMADAIRHRGPDDVGFLVEPGIALAHRRLSIIDLSAAGHQPMASADGRYHIIYNGEVYNYRELAEKLPDVRWRSQTDTEVVLEAFAAWGPACLDQLVGMFSFAIWDRAEQRLFCARDRLGIKPLYYARLGEGWAIGSEIGALLAAGVPARANERVIYDFLARDFYEHDDASFFAGVDKLPPAHSMWLAAGREPNATAYWNLAREAAAIEPSQSRSERGAELVARLQDAVRLALRSDVPVGITLSGGLDSATLLTLVDRAQPAADKIAAFSFDFDHPQYSERPWVEAMATHTGHVARFRTVAPDDFAASLDRIVRQQQEPHAGAPITAYTLCFEQLREHGVIVAMDGSGIDEGLAGYARFRPALWADLAAANRHDELSLELEAAGMANDLDRARAQMAAATSEHGDIGRGQDLTASVRPDCVAPALQTAALPAFARPFPDALRNLMFRELRYTKLPRALRFRDRLSMAVGCELRPPFLDHRVLAYMFALPAEDRIHRGTTKALLRDAAAQLLPDAVRLASKRSVQTPQREWFRGPLASWVREHVDTPRFWQRGWVDKSRALAAIEQFLAGEGDNSFFLWQWIALERWAQAYLD